MPRQSKAMTIAGWTLTVVLFLFLTLVSGLPKFMNQPYVKTSMDRLEWGEDLRITLGIVEMSCAVLFLLPRTAVLGAILLTGYLGGATASHVRVHIPWFFPVGLGVLVWLALYLRDWRIRTLLPITPSSRNP